MGGDILYYKKDGERIKITFDEEIVGDLSSNFTNSNWDINAFQINYYYPLYVVGGPSQSVTSIPASIEYYASFDSNLNFTSASTSQLEIFDAKYVLDIDRFVPQAVRVEVKEVMPQ